LPSQPIPRLLLLLFLHAVLVLLVAPLVFRRLLDASPVAVVFRRLRVGEM
jgi:hypothetical protein